MNTNDIRQALAADDLDAWARHAQDASGFGHEVSTAAERGSKDCAPRPVSSPVPNVASARYAKCVEVSKRIRWDIDRDVIRGRRFDFAMRFLPDGLSKVDSLGFLSSDEKRFLSQVQGRTYANIFGLVERFIAAKVLEMSKDHWLGDQSALEAMVRFGDEEIKHQELFRRIECMCAEGMPNGYTFLPEPNAVATWFLEGKARKRPYSLLFRHKGQTIARELQIGQKTYSPAWVVGDKDPMTTEIKMREVKLFGVVPGLGGWLPAWMVGYLVLAVPLVFGVKWLLRIY